MTGTLPRKETAQLQPPSSGKGAGKGPCVRNGGEGWVTRVGEMRGDPDVRAEVGTAPETEGGHGQERRRGLTEGDVAVRGGKD